MKEFRNLVCVLLMLYPFLYIAPVHSFFSWVVKKQIRLSKFKKEFESTGAHYGLLLLINFMFNVHGSKLEIIIMMVCFGSQRNLQTHITPTWLFYGVTCFIFARDRRAYFWIERDQTQYNREMESKTTLFISLIIALRYMLVRLVDIIIEAESEIQREEAYAKNPQKIEGTEP